MISSFIIVIITTCNIIITNYVNAYMTMYKLTM